MDDALLRARQLAAKYRAGTASAAFQHSGIRSLEFT